MYAAERQQLLAERLQHDGRLAVIDLAEELEVSSETIRRDLAVLEREGVAQRVHGGAVATRALTILVPNLAQREVVHAEQKRRLAREAARLLPEAGGSVVLDAGTTLSEPHRRFSSRPQPDRDHARDPGGRQAHHDAVRLPAPPRRAVDGATAAAMGPATIDALAAFDRRVLPRDERRVDGSRAQHP